MKRSYIREILDAINEDTISFAGGLPSTEMLPTEQIAKCATSVLKESKALQYSSSYGLDELREFIASYYTKLLDFPTTKEQILITTGSQQAFDLICKAIKPKEIITQEPTYIGAIGAFKSLGVKLDSFRHIYELQAKLDSNRVVYAMSDYQNPTGACYSKAQRDELAQAVNQRGGTLIEDGAYSFLNFDGKYQKPVSALCSRSFHLGSFSKIVAPGLRVGWIRAKEEQIERLLIVKESLDLHTATMNQMIITEFLKTSDFKLHLKTLQLYYYHKMKVMSNALKEEGIEEFIEPEGGMFLYVNLRCNAKKLAKHLLTKNLAIVPGDVFDIKERSSTWVRLNFSNADNEEIKAGVRILAHEMKAYKRESIWFYIFKQRLSSL